MIRIQKQISVACLIALILGAGACTRTPMQKRDRYIEAGKKLFEKKEYPRAILEFRNAVAVMPKDAEAYYQLGRAYSRNRDYQTAVNTFQKALQLNPKHTGAELELSKILAATIDLENLQSAESRLAALLQGGYTDPEALNSLALTEMKLGKIDSAVNNLERSLALSPQTLSSSILLAQAKLAKRDSKGAEDVLLKACADSPKSAGARVILGSFYVSRGRMPEAEQEFQKALNLDSHEASALLELGRLQSSSGRKQDADQTFRRLAALPDPSTKPVHALFLLQEGRQDEAIREFEQLAKSNPDDRAARTRLVAVYWSAGRKQDAEKTLQAALTKNSKDVEALLQRGELYLMNGKYDLAETDLNQVLRRQPDSAVAHFILSRLHQARGGQLLQRQELSEAVRLSPPLLQARLELAQLLINTKAAKSALEVLNEAPAFQRNMLPILIQRNWALWALEDLDQLRSGIDQGLAAVRVPDLLIQDGLLRMRKGDYKGAHNSLEEALKVDPQDLRALEVLRRSYVLQKQVQTSVQKVREYASTAPRSAPVQEFLGNVLMASGDKEGARTAFEAAKTADETFEQAKMSLSQLDYSEGKFDTARERLKTIVAANPESTLARVWLADVEATHGNQETALTEYRRVLDTQPTHMSALNNTAYLLAELKNQPDEALKYAEKAHELDPENPNYSDTLGWILYRKGLYSMAVRHLESAASHKGNVVWQYHLAMAYAKAGDPGRARDALIRALQVNPNVPEAKAASQVVGSVK